VGCGAPIVWCVHDDVLDSARGSFRRPQSALAGTPRRRGNALTWDPLLQEGLFGVNSNYNAEDCIGDDYDGDLRKSPALSPR